MGRMGRFLLLAVGGAALVTAVALVAAGTRSDPRRGDTSLGRVVAQRTDAARPEDAGLARRDRPRCGRRPLRRRHRSLPGPGPARPQRRHRRATGPGGSRHRPGRWSVRRRRCFGRRVALDGPPDRAWPSTPTGTSTSPRPRRSGYRRSTRVKPGRGRRQFRGAAGRSPGRAVRRPSWSPWPAPARPDSTATACPARPANSTSRPGWRSTAAGDVFIADTANCRVRVLAAHDGTVLGRPVTTGHLTTVAGTGVCGSAGQGGPLTSAELWNPVAVALDRSGDLFVADSGDQSVLVGLRRRDDGLGHDGRRGRPRPGRGWDGGLRAVSG